MTARRYGPLGLSLLLLLALSGAAQAAEPKARHEQRRRDGFLVRVVYLMPPAFEDELRLSDAQRKKIHELQEELRQQRRQVLLKVVMRVRAILASLEEEGKEEPTPVLAIAHEITGGLLEMRRNRVGLEKKMLAVLDAGQREEYAELKARPPQRGRRGSAAAAPSSIFSPDVQRRLHLSAEQRRKLADLQHERETKARGLLTEEQQRQYDDLTGGRRTRKKSQPRDPGSDRGAKPGQKKTEPSK